MADSNIDATEAEAEDFVQCQLVYEPEKMQYLLGSNLSSPSLAHPIALVSRESMRGVP